MATYTSENAEGHLISNKGFNVVQNNMPVASLSYKYEMIHSRKVKNFLKHKGC